MYNHKQNIDNLKKILDFLNKLPDIEYKFSLKKKKLLNIYKSFFYIIDILQFMFYIKKKQISEKKKRKKMLKIKDLEGNYIFTKQDIEEIYPHLNNLDIFFSIFKGGGNMLYYFSDLEDKYGTKATVAFEIISSINSNIAYICSMIVSTLGYPPFSVPPMSLSIFVPKLIIRCTKYFFIGYNLCLNISRKNWSIVIKNLLSSFPQFLITENAISTQLISINKILKSINVTFEELSSFSIDNLLGQNDKKRNALMKQLKKYKH